MINQFIKALESAGFIYCKETQITKPTGYLHEKKYPLTFIPSNKTIYKYSNQEGITYNIEYYNDDLFKYDITYPAGIRTLNIHTTHTFKIDNIYMLQDHIKFLNERFLIKHRDNKLNTLLDE